jgi:ABC-type multidrug transport system fused ATPase/permease subunit
LILDEATNALDADSEAIVLDRLQDLQRSTTTLVIAHRLQTVRHADLVIVLDAGRVIELGPPATLIAGDGAFSRLWRRETTVGQTTSAGSPHA